MVRSPHQPRAKELRCEAQQLLDSFEERGQISVDIISAHELTHTGTQFVKSSEVAGTRSSQPSSPAGALTSPVQVYT